MLIREVLEIYEGKKAKKAPEPVKPTKSMEELVEKFKASGGELIGEIKNGKLTGQVGAHNKGKWNQAIIVFYPDGQYERFDYDSKVIYKDGWTAKDVEIDKPAGKPKILSDKERQVKEFEKNKKEYARKVKKERKQAELQQTKVEKKFNRDTEKATKWLAAVDIDAPENRDIKTFLNKKNGVIDNMAILYKVVCHDKPSFASESLEMKLKTIVDLYTYATKYAETTKEQKAEYKEQLAEFLKLPTKWHRWVAAAILL